MMSREDAISHIWGLSITVEIERCVGKGESDALSAETADALRVLGVSSDEMNGVSS